MNNNIYSHNKKIVTDRYAALASVWRFMRTKLDGNPINEDRWWGPGFMDSQQLIREQDESARDFAQDLMVAVWKEFRRLLMGKQNVDRINIKCGTLDEALAAAREAEPESLSFEKGNERTVYAIKGNGKE